MRDRDVYFCRTLSTQTNDQLIHTNLLNLVKLKLNCLYITPYKLWILNSLNEFKNPHDKNIEYISLFNDTFLWVYIFLCFLKTIMKPFETDNKSQPKPEPKLFIFGEPKS